MFPYRFSKHYPQLSREIKLSIISICVLGNSLKIHIAEIVHKSILKPSHWVEKMRQFTEEWCHIHSHKNPFNSHFMNKSQCAAKTEWKSYLQKSKSICPYTVTQYHSGLSEHRLYLTDSNTDFTPQKLICACHLYNARVSKALCLLSEKNQRNDS